MTYLRTTPLSQTVNSVQMYFHQKYTWKYKLFMSKIKIIFILGLINQMNLYVNSTLTLNQANSFQQIECCSYLIFHSGSLPCSFICSWTPASGKKLVKFNSPPNIMRPKRHCRTRQGKIIIFDYLELLYKGFSSKGSTFQRQRTVFKNICYPPCTSVSKI